MFTFAIDYYLFISVASFGVIQFAAATAGLQGILILKKDPLNRIVGICFVIVAIVWFFDPSTRNINDHEGGLDANQQAILFLLGTASAFLLTAGISSLLNVGMKGETPKPGEGLQDLKSTNFAIAIGRNIQFWLKEWREQTKSYFSG